MSKGTCKADSCQKEVVGRGYCRSHYQQWKRGKLPKPRYKTCVEEGCKKRQVAAARCEAHQKVKSAGAEASAEASR
jgi:hypothetical protein